MWRFSFLIAIGCTEHGQTPPGGAPDASTDAGSPEVGDAFLPQICTGGLSGDPSCPINQVSLESFGAPGASFDFVAQPLGSSLFLTDTQIVPGAIGTLHVVHPEILHVPDGGVPTSTGDAYAGFDMFIVSPTALPDTALTAAVTEKLLLRFDLVELI